MAATALVVTLTSCGGSKQATNSTYYNSPESEQRLATLEVDRLAAAETDNLRAVGVATDADEMEARKEALQAGQLEIANLLETSIVALIQQYTQKDQLGNKKLTEGQRKEFVEMSIAQKISTRAIGAPDRFRNSDGSYKIYRCVELKVPTKEVLGQVYDDMTREEIIGIDYDKNKFIQDNLDKIQELRENAQ